MEIDPNLPPPLPPQIQGRNVRRVDGTRTQAVTIRDGARLLGISEDTMRERIDTGQVDICRDGSTAYVLIDSLWLLVPEEDRRVPSLGRSQS